MFKKSILSLSLVALIAPFASVAMACQGADQLAKQLGVPAGAHSVNEMIRLQDAIRQNDSKTVAFILGGSNGGNTRNDIGIVTPAKVQLAVSLGLDPAAHITADLVARYLYSIS